MAQRVGKEWKEDVVLEQAFCPVCKCGLFTKFTKEEAIKAQTARIKGTRLRINQLLSEYFELRTELIKIKKTDKEIGRCMARCGRFYPWERRLKTGQK